MHVGICMPLLTGHSCGELIQSNGAGLGFFKAIVTFRAPWIQIHPVGGCCHLALCVEMEGWAVFLSALALGFQLSLQLCTTKALPPHSSPPPAKDSACYLRLDSLGGGGKVVLGSPDPDLVLGRPGAPGPWGLSFIFGAPALFPHPHAIQTALCPCGSVERQGVGGREFLVALQW